MFWGLIMEPKRRYTQVVKRPFHISMAALDIFSADDDPTQVMLFFEERNYLLCTLQKGQTLQCALDLNFEMGDEVVFATNGNSNIHLSGYIQEEFDEFLDNEGEDDDEVEEQEEIEESKVSKNRKNKMKENLSKQQPPRKKSKLAKLLEDEYGSDDEDESFVLSESVEDEEDDGDLDEDMEDEEDEDDEVIEEDKSDASSLSEEEVKSPKKQINGEKATSRKNQRNTIQQEVTRSGKKGKNEKTPMKTPKTDVQQKNKTPKSEESPLQHQQKKTLEGGVIIQDLKVGEGNVAKAGKMLQVYYEGRLKQNNKLFDQSNKGAGFKFRLGKQEVIKGWDVGVVGMKVGGRRRIICPPAMAYGQKGSPPAIPPNSSLVFEVELKNVV